MLYVAHAVGDIFRIGIYQALIVFRLLYHHKCQLKRQVSNSRLYIYETPPFYIFLNRLLSLLTRSSTLPIQSAYPAELPIPRKQLRFSLRLVKLQTNYDPHYPPAASTPSLKNAPSRALSPPPFSSIEFSVLQLRTSNQHFRATVKAASLAKEK